MSERGHMRGYRRGGFPGVYTGGQWETAHATFYGGSDASGVVVVTIFDGEELDWGEVTNAIIYATHRKLQISKKEEDVRT